MKHAFCMQVQCNQAREQNFFQNFSFISQNYNRLEVTNLYVEFKLLDVCVNSILWLQRITLFSNNS